MCTRRALGRLLGVVGHATAQVLLSWGPCGSSLGLRFPTWVSPAEPGAPWTSSYPHGAPALGCQAACGAVAPETAWGLWGGCQPWAGSGWVLMERLGCLRPPSSSPASGR